ncbi:hypothetical protein SDC9_131573 [bioreactor metagenome]|uniref:Uncharacterized protein n=1 Tax=bioreactor metagenome TaxID=1076179 RepID=A0A645D5I7_9ZZZZ
MLALLAQPNGIDVVGDDGHFLLEGNHRSDYFERGRPAVDVQSVALFDHGCHGLSDDFLLFGEL